MVSIESLNKTAFKRQRGATLIEVLITFLVLAIGLLGVASMQRFTVNENVDTAQRSKSMWLMQDVVERIRSNNSATAINAYINAAASYPPTVNQCSTAPSTVCNSTCSPAELAAYDLWDAFCQQTDTTDREIVNDVKLTGFSVACYDSNGGDLAGNCNGYEKVLITLNWLPRNAADNTVNDSSDSSSNRTISYDIVP